MQVFRLFSCNCQPIGSFWAESLTWSSEQIAFHGKDCETVICLNNQSWDIKYDYLGTYFEMRDHGCGLC